MNPYREEVQTVEQCNSCQRREHVKRGLWRATKTFLGGAPWVAAMFVVGHYGFEHTDAHSNVNLLWVTLDFLGAGAASALLNFAVSAYKAQP